jgi:hypothetical protein
MSALDEIRQRIQDEQYGMVSQTPVQDAVEGQKLRQFAQGVTFGFGDEIEGLIRSSLPGGPEYDAARDEVRNKLKAYQQANPGEALTMELAGALIPSIVMSMTGVGTGGAGANIGRIAGQAAVESALTAAGTTEADLTSLEGLQDVGVGTTAGALMGTALEAGGGRAGKGLNALMSYVRRKMGGADSAVQAELLRLQKATGLSVEELIADVANGRIMADNATLSAAIKGMVNEGGETASQILSLSGARRQATTGQAQESLRTALSPDVDDPNLIRARMAREEELQDEASEAYKKVYAKPESQVTTPEVANQLLNVVRTNPALRADLETFYRNEGFVPLFKDMPDGSIEYARAPTLQDAETARGIIRDEASALFAASKGTLGYQKKQQEKKLKSALDTSSPELSAAVSNYAKMASQRDAFEAGKKKALTRNVDELQVDLERMNPDDLAAYRAGAMAALTDRARRSGTTLENMAKEDVQLGAALRVLLPSEQAGTVLRDVGRASEAISMDKIIQPRNQSITQALQREAQMRGGAASMEDVFRGVTGDPMAITKLMVSMVPSAKGLSDAQMSEVAKILYTESPELIRQALTDQTVTGAVLRKAEAIISGAAQYGRTAGAQQGAQLGVEN